jgi:murein DD-endopeptidase MepM/ murein hydrolase activator NlpD
MDKSHIFFDSNVELALKKHRKTVFIRNFFFTSVISILSVLCIIFSLAIEKPQILNLYKAQPSSTPKQASVNSSQIRIEASRVANSLSLPTIPPASATTLTASKAKQPAKSQEYNPKTTATKTAVKPATTKPTIKTTAKTTPAKTASSKTKKPLGGGDTAPVAMDVKHAMDESLPVAKLDPKPASAQYGIPEYWPLPVPVSDPYGYRAWRGRFHSGIDLTAPEGTPICAAGAGKIIRAEWYCGYGNCVDIEHASGYITRYGHLSSYYVKLGQWVDEGEWIGGVGNTGNSSCDHLHFEVFLNSRTINPESLRWLNKVTALSNGIIIASVACPI